MAPIVWFICLSRYMAVACSRRDWEASDKVVSIMLILRKIRRMTCEHGP